MALLGCTMVAGSAGSATAAEPRLNCVMGTTTCSYSSQEFAAAGQEPIVTLWTETGFRGTGVTLWGNTRSDGRVCTPPTDTYEATVYLGGALYMNVESVDDYPGAHCDWRLVGPNGGTSVRVEGDILDLRNLGDGWRNRAVAIQFT